MNDHPRTTIRRGAFTEKRAARTRVGAAWAAIAILAMAADFGILSGVSFETRRSS
jgi:hypothetical protein